MGKYGGVSPPFVDCGRRWSTVDRGQGLGGGSPELGLATAPGHSGSPAVVQRKEGCTGSPSQASKGHTQLRGDWAMMVKRWWWWRSMGAELEHEERRRRVRRGAVKTGRGISLL
jgi:hypothetical protein